MTEKHIENIVKMMGQLRCAYNAYKVGNTGTEVYFMVRAEAYADALGISHDEFLDYKMMVEKENEMVDTLMMPIECINSINDMDRQIRELESKIATYPKPKEDNEKVHIVVVQDGNDIDVDVYRKHEDAFKQLEAEAKGIFKKDQKDVYGQTSEEAVKNGYFRLDEDVNHYDIYAFVDEVKVQ